MIQRSREYGDMSGLPMPLGLSEVKDYIEIVGTHIPTDEFIEAIFSVDDVYLEKAYDRHKRGSKT